MKIPRHILTTLLSAYLLILMVMPCSEAHAQEAKYHAEHSQSGDDHHHDGELCSPFCVCSSCLSAIAIQSPLEFHVIEVSVEYNREISNFYQSIESTFHGSIWQPPQLV